MLLDSESVSGIAYRVQLSSGVFLKLVLCSASFLAVHVL